MDLSRAVTLRDLLRAWERGSERARPVIELVDLLIPASPPVSSYAGLYYSGRQCPLVREIRAELDRLISRYGPDAILAVVLEAEPVRKAPAWRTQHQIGWLEVDEDGPHTNPNADTHGGDGNSGECDHPAETAAADREGDGTQAADSGGEPGSSTGEAGASSGGGGSGHGHHAACDAGCTMDTPNRPSGQESGSDVASNGGSESTGQDAASRKGAGQPTGEGDRGADEAAAGMGSHLSERGRAGDDQDAASGHPATADASDAQAGLTADGTPDSGGAAGDAGTPSSTTDSYGGEHLAAGQEVRTISERTRRAAREVNIALRRIIESACLPRGRETPRVDGRALVRELVSRRVALHRIRRQDADIRDLVIAVDDSESCDHTVDAVYRSAIAVARTLPPERVSVIIHSNGWAVRPGAMVAPWLRRILARYARELGRNYYSRAQREASEAVWDEIARARPGLVLAMGDADADFVLERISEAGVQVVMLAHTPYAPDTYTVLGPVYDAESAARALSKWDKRRTT
ncbi:MAG: hypothetical protein N2690_01420 [Rhodocyclaceae bacterium]|nr:hypothetical protein [Rhodocyclaceae bacterium]